MSKASVALIVLQISHAIHALRVISLYPPKSALPPLGLHAINRPGDAPKTSEHILNFATFVDESEYHHSYLQSATHTSSSESITRNLLDSLEG